MRDEPTLDYLANGQEPLERAGGFMGLGIVLVASVAVFATSAPSPEAAELSASRPPAGSHSVRCS